MTATASGSGIAPVPVAALPQEYPHLLLQFPEQADSLSGASAVCRVLQRSLTGPRVFHQSNCVFAVAWRQNDPRLHALARMASAVWLLRRRRVILERLVAQPQARWPKASAALGHQCCRRGHRICMAAHRHRPRTVARMLVVTTYLKRVPMTLIVDALARDEWAQRHLALKAPSVLVVYDE